MIDWDDLQFYLAVARHGTLSAAARALRVTQPTAGRRIAAFERKLGAKLFERTVAGFVPTDVGRSVLEHAEQMQAHALSAENLAAGRDVGIAGRVRITASEWVIRSLLGPVLAPYSARHPSVSLELIADARHLSLIKREADLALRPSPFTQREIVQREVAVVAFGLYASDAYLARYGVPDFTRGCEGHALIDMTDDVNNIVDRAWLPPLAAKARTVIRTNGREPMATLAAAGIGMACLPRFLGDATPGLRLLLTPIPGPERPLWLGVHRAARATPRIRVTLDFVRESLERLRPALRP